METVPFEECEAVEQGEVLAELDVSEARAEHTRAAAQAEQARHDYQRTAELRERGLVSSSEYERARTALNVAESEHDLWETRSRFGSIASPREAVVANRYIEPGETVDARDTLFELVAMDRLVLRLGVSELDVVHRHRARRCPCAWMRCRTRSLRA